ncbi:hypothetical protein BX070DRAFT_228983 [Coemansia spiralis]|nr:hypothetical protein BX070DRAFT_228983 [Coemansia spiralis]
MDIDIADEDLQFEDELQREPYKLKGWLRYIEHKNGGQSRTLSIIYERALRNLPRSYKLWAKYLEHRTRDVGKTTSALHAEYEKVNLCFERALLHLHTMPRLWLRYLRFLMGQADVTRTRRTFDRALRALPVTQHMRVWQRYLKFARRVGGESSKRIYHRYLKMWPERAEEYVDHCVDTGQWGEAAVWLVRMLDTASPRGTSEFQLWKQLARVLRMQPLVPVDTEAVLRAGISRFNGQGDLWTTLANYHIATGALEQARDVFEQALGGVATLRDFALVFDAYAEFEESMVTAEMEAMAAGRGSQTRLDLWLLRLERLMDRRPFLVNDVELKQSPGVAVWLKRAGLWQARYSGAKSDSERREAARQITETFERAVSEVDPRKAEGRVSEIWAAYAEHFDEAEKWRAVLDRAVAAPLGSVEELASLYVGYAERELSRGDTERALQVLTRATRARPGKVDYRDETQPAQHRVFKSLKVWTLLVDILESTGAVAATRAAYDRMLELRIATPQTIVNYADFLEENHYYEDCFKAFERGIELFGYPVAVELWNIYLRRFARRFGAAKLERTRDLHEQALEKCPGEYAKPIYLAYGELEEASGQPRRALKIYERATHGVSRGDRLEMFRYFAAKTAKLLGAVHTRAIYERGIEELADPLELVMEYAQVERQLGEIDRARALYGYASQMADPRVKPAMWAAWHEFEVQHGNEETFREMLRVKRSVQTRYSSDSQHLAAELRRKEAVGDGAHNGSGAGEAERAEQAEEANPDEVSIDVDDL